jgi:hypothetical protein
VRLFQRNTQIYCPQEVVQLAGITLNEVEVTSSNPPSPLLYGHVKKKKHSNFFTILKLGCYRMVSKHYPTLDGGSTQAYEGVASAMLWNAKSGLPHEGQGCQEWGNLVWVIS